MNDLLSIRPIRPCGYLLLAMILLSGRLAAQSNPEPPPRQVQFADVTIPNTAQIGHHSAITNQDYVLQINFPAGYEKSTASYPVLYLLDGQWDFPLLSAIYGEQYFDGFIPGVIT